MKLHLGAGSCPQDGWVNHDLVPLPGIDITHDLDVFPWPWDDSAAEHVLAVDVFEHMWHPLPFMRECHRVLAPGGVLELHTVVAGSKNHFTDPDHKRAVTDESFDYWVPGTYLHDRYGAAYAQGCHFAKINLYLEGSQIIAILKTL